MTWQIETTKAQDTEALAAKLGKNLTGGEVIELVSDLGGGKTTFVRGLVQGLGSSDHVTSPTFKLSNEYKGKGLKVIHFDFYRLGEAGLMSNELQEEIGHPKNVVVVEWADVVRGVLPEKRLTITFNLISEDKRHLHFDYPESLSYLLKGLL